jgi:hypothetical protein
MSAKGRREPAWAAPFLEALARSGCVRQAARETPVNRGSVYHRRRSNAEFAQALDEALALGKAGPPPCLADEQPEIVGPPVPDWPGEFLDALAETSSVMVSAVRANVAVRSVYRRKREDPRFAAGWLAALHEGYDQLEMELVGYLRDPAPRRRMDVTGAIRLLTAHREMVERRRALIGEEETDERAMLESLDQYLRDMRRRRFANEAILIEAEPADAAS